MTLGISRLFALLALAGLLAFFGVIMKFVPRLDLSVVLVICLALVIYDLWTQLGRRRR
jgi:hypothetical protein